MRHSTSYSEIFQIHKIRMGIGQTSNDNILEVMDEDMNSNNEEE